MQEYATPHYKSPHSAAIPSCTYVLLLRFSSEEWWFHLLLLRLPHYRFFSQRNIWDREGGGERRLRLLNLQWRKKRRREQTKENGRKNSGGGGAKGRRAEDRKGRAQQSSIKLQDGIVCIFVMLTPLKKHNYPLPLPSFGGKTDGTYNQEGEGRPISSSSSHSTTYHSSSFVCFSFAKKRKKQELTKRRNILSHF